MQSIAKYTNPVTESLLQVVDIIAAPKVALERCSARMPWLVFTAIVLALTTTTLFYGFNRVASAFLASHEITQSGLKIMWLSFGIQPVIVLAKWALIAVTLLVGSQLRLLSDVTYPKLFVLVVSAQVLQVLHEAVQLVVAGITNDSPLKPLEDIGLNLLFAPQTMGHAVGSLLNPFAIWYVVILWAGLRVISRCKPIDATVAMLPYVVLSTAALIGGALVKLTHGM